jgi:hypothetical protein
LSGALFIFLAREIARKKNKKAGTGGGLAAQKI